MKILVVEDDIKIVNFLKKGLQEESYSVDYCLNGDEAIYLASVNIYDIILLDIMIPIKDGIEVCKEIRLNKINTPIIMLTAKNTTEDTIKGLDIGANDYLSKPFSFSELLARIRVQLRLKNENQTIILKIADLQIDLVKKCVHRAGKKIELTAKEFSLLEYLIRNKNSILSESVILSSLSNMEDTNISNIINVYIYRLRNKIDKPFKKKLIKTVRGMGFKISDE
ncbi:MAG: response regulator [Campylobacterota bacterium]